MAVPESHDAPRGLSPLASGALALVALVELLRTAWLCDDSLITLRVVLNFNHGHGPVFNLGERVQAFTHPLWFLLISGADAVLGNVFVVAFVLPIVLSVGALWIMMRRVARTRSGGFIAAGAMLLSKAYVDYSTSGLENPLSHLLLLGAVMAGSSAVSGPEDNRNVTAFFLACSLLYLSRPDLLLMMAPAALLVVMANRRRPAALARAISIGALPAAAWTLFSLSYYGFPFPNTAYAKLATGFPHFELIVQGLKYLRESMIHDPLTLAVIALGCALGFLSGRLDRALAAGILMSLLYVIWIGGDFMSGRFLSVPFLAACIVVARTVTTLRAVWTAAAVVAVLGLPHIGSTLASGSRYQNQEIGDDGIADERGFYFQESGLLPAPAGTFAAPDWTLRDRRVLTAGRLGATGLAVGPATHLVDAYALADPLLARLPARRMPDWRIGHFARQIPTDYLTSVARDENLLADPAAARLYEVLRRITRGPLNDLERLRAILNVNLGRLPSPDSTLYAFGVVRRSSHPARISLARAASPTEPFRFGPAPEAHGVGFGGHVEIMLPRPAEVQKIELSAGRDDYYEVGVAMGDDYRSVGRIYPFTDQPGFVQHAWDLEPHPGPADRIWVMALAGDGLYELRDLRVQTSGDVDDSAGGGLTPQEPTAAAD